MNGYIVFPLADYQIDARVLSTRRYSDDQESDLSPVDLALGWGPMNKPHILEALSISQADRAYRWTTEKRPMPAAEINRNAANVHIIPADPKVEKFVTTVPAGSLVSLKGSLVRVSGPDGYTWISSFSRDDSGDGACEVLYVRSAELIPPPGKAPPPIGASTPPVKASPRPSHPAVVPVKKSVKTIVLRLPVNVPLKYGTLTIPAGETISVLEERGGKIRSSFRGHEFWTEPPAGLNP